MEVIKILFDIKESEYKDLLIQIAADSPAIFVKSYKKIHVNGDAIITELLEIYNSTPPAGFIDDKVPAIKKYREMFSCTLKEAKEAIENIIENGSIKNIS